MKYPISEMFRKQFNLFKYLILIGTSLVCSISNANITITPKRVVLEDRTRAKVVNVLNKGNETATYRISMVNFSMSDDGQLELIEAPKGDEKFADSMLRFSPRQVTLKPGQSQVVRIMLRKPGNLQAAEYRSHLKFSLIPEMTELTQSIHDSEKVGITLIARSGIAIPVIVRHGTLKASTELNDLRISKTANDSFLNLTINRSGSASIYGSLLINTIDQNGQIRPYDIYKGMAIYTPNTFRKISLPIADIDELKSQKMKLQVIFQSKSKHHKQPTILSKKSVQL